MGFILIQKGVFKAKLKRDFKTGVENDVPHLHIYLYFIIPIWQSEKGCVSLRWNVSYCEILVRTYLPTLYYLGKIKTKEQKIQLTREKI